MNFNLSLSITSNLDEKLAFFLSLLNKSFKKLVPFLLLKVEDIPAK